MDEESTGILFAVIAMAGVAALGLVLYLVFKTMLILLLVALGLGAALLPLFLRRQKTRREGIR